MDDFSNWRQMFHDGVTREFLVAADKTLTQSFNNDSRVKAACVRTNCIVELTPRFIRKRAGLYKEEKYFIVCARGADDQSIERCNKLIEAIYPFYSQRKVYDRKKQKKPEMGDGSSDQVSPWDIFQQLNNMKSSSVDLAQIASNIACEKGRQRGKASRDPQIEEKHHKAYRHPKEDLSNMAVIEGKPYLPIDDTTECPHLTRPSQWGFFKDDEEESTSEAFCVEASSVGNSNSEPCPDLSDHEQFMICLDDSLRRSQYWSLPSAQQNEVPPLFYRNPLRNAAKRTEKQKTKVGNEIHDTNANNCLQFERRRRIYQSIVLNFQTAWRNLLINPNNKNIISSQSKNANNSLSKTDPSTFLTKDDSDPSHQQCELQPAAFRTSEDIFLEPFEDKTTKKIEENETDNLIKDFHERKKMDLPENKDIIDDRIKEAKQLETEAFTLQHCPNLSAAKEVVRESKPTYRYRPDPLLKTEETEIDRQIRDFMARRRASAENCHYPNPSAIFQFIPAHDTSFYPRKQLWQKSPAPRNLYPTGIPHLERSKKQPVSEYRDQHKPHTQPVKPTAPPPAPQGQHPMQIPPATQGQHPTQIPPPVYFQYPAPFQQPQHGSADQDEKLTQASTQPLEPLDAQLQLAQQAPSAFQAAAPQQLVPWTQPQLPTSQWYPYAPSTCAICPHGFIQDNSERRTNQARSRMHQRSRRQRRHLHHRRHHRRSPDKHRHQRHRRRSSKDKSPRPVHDACKEVLSEAVTDLLSKLKDKENFQSLLPPLASKRPMPDEAVVGKNDDTKKPVKDQTLEKKEKAEKRSKKAKEASTEEKTDSKFNVKRPLQSNQKEASTSGIKECFTSGAKKAFTVSKGNIPSSKEEATTSNKKNTSSPGKAKPLSTNKKSVIPRKQDPQKDLTSKVNQLPRPGKKTLVISDEKVTVPTELSVTKDEKRSSTGSSAETKSTSKDQKSKKAMTLKTNQPGFKISTTIDEKQIASNSVKVLDSGVEDEILNEKETDEVREMTGSDSTKTKIGDGSDVFKLKEVETIDERHSVGSFISNTSKDKIGSEIPRDQPIIAQQPVAEIAPSSGTLTNSSPLLSTEQSEQSEQSALKRRAHSDTDLGRFSHTTTESDKETETTKSTVSRSSKLKTSSAPKLTGLNRMSIRYFKRSSCDETMANLRRRPSLAMVSRPSSLWSTYAADGKRKSIFDILAGSRMSVISGRQSVASTITAKKSLQRSVAGANFSNLAKIPGPPFGQEGTNATNSGAPERSGKSRLSFNFSRKKQLRDDLEIFQDKNVVKVESSVSIEEYFWKLIQRLDISSPDISFTTSSSATVRNKDSKKEPPPAELSESTSVSQRIDALRRYISRLITFDVSPRSRKKRQSWKNFQSSTNTGVIKD